MTATSTFDRYLASLAAGDMTALASTLHPDVVWHQPGTHPLSGDHVGPAAVLALLGGMMERSAGSLVVATDASIVGGDLVAATVTFTGTREGRAPLHQHGVDVFRVQDDRIVEVWLMSEDQAAEDAFWV
ncbi:nuclear transport factor 2 family protein [Plantibacter sp. YIM 135249]|jgi:ketosteroid isomerase-like protein|uniref:nuclear transport factor 2 family protein n=1 Tax=Plantibacter sp. YIM 135249 TaxID=3423918 RepID=UPI003D34C7BD